MTGRLIDFNQLVTGADAAHRLAIDQSRISQLHPHQRGFPQPLGKIGTSWVWPWPEIEAWAPASAHLLTTEEATRRPSIDPTTRSTPHLQKP